MVDNIGVSYRHNIFLITKSLNRAALEGFFLAQNGPLGVIMHNSKHDWSTAS